eukprot:g1215.t1
MWRNWFERVRWKTLSAALGPALVGTGLALSTNHSLSFLPFLCCGPAAFLIQIGTNLTNDALDYQNGIEKWKNTKHSRLGKFPHRSAPAFYALGVACFPLALFCSIPAILLRGWKLLALEIVCCIAGYLYTGGPFPLAYFAFGDLTVLTFFGVLATSGAAFVHRGGSLLTQDGFIGGLQVGFMAVNLMVINNLRDAESDARGGKLTISNLLGYELGRWQLVLNCVCAYALSLWWLLNDSFTAFVLPLLTVPFAVSFIKNAFKTKPSILYNRFLQEFSLLHLMFCGALGLGLAIPELYEFQIALGS